MKDPAFLFYTKDFQTGTQDMTCEEIGTYLRLLMYQHQHESIPTDKERLMRITGIFSVKKFDEIWGTIQKKFVTADNQMHNERLTTEIEKRAFGKQKKIASATFAGLISSHKQLTTQQKEHLKNSFDLNKYIKSDTIQIKLQIREWFSTMVNQMVNNTVNADADADVNVNAGVIKNGKEGSGEKPTVTHTVTLPYPSAEFAAQWLHWKNYLQKKYRFNYQCPESEQAALAQLNTLAQGQQTTATAILHQSMAQGWKGLFELKTQSNAGKPPAGKSKVNYSDGFKQKIAARLQSG